MRILDFFKKIHNKLRKMPDKEVFRSEENGTGADIEVRANEVNKFPEIMNYSIRISNSVEPTIDVKSSFDIGSILYHKYLGEIKIVSIGEEVFSAKTNNKGVLEFKYYDIGKVIYNSKDHIGKSYSSYVDYMEFNYKEQVAIKAENAKRKEETKKLRKKLEHEVKQTKTVSNSNRDSAISTRVQINKDNEFDKIKKIVNRRNIEALMHFTRMENLKSILAHGLVPIDMQSDYSLAAIRNDHGRYDNRLNCTSLSVSFPNYKLFYKFREYQYSGTRWVVLVLKPELLYSEQNKVYFCSANAARSNIYLNDDSLTTATAFENMFCNQYTEDGNNSIDRRNLKISDNFTTNPQAELLVGGIIQPTLISSVRFRTKDQLNEFMRSSGYQFLNKFKFEIGEEYFGPRSDYSFWQGR